MPAASNIVRFSTGQMNHTGLRYANGSIRVLRCGDRTWQTNDLGSFANEQEWRTWAASQEQEIKKTTSAFRSFTDALASFLLGNAGPRTGIVHTRSVTRAAEALVQLSQSAPAPASAAEPRYNLRSRRA